MKFGGVLVRLVCTAFGLGLIAMFITAYIGDVHIGWEIWWEIPLIIGLCVSVWIFRQE